MARAPGSGTPPLRRLLVRVALVLLAPIGAIYWHLSAGPFGFIAGSAVVWSALEAGIFYKVRAASLCKHIPFFIRLLCGFGLDVQVAWLMGTEVSSPTLPPEYGSLMDNISNMVVAAKLQIDANVSDKRVAGPTHPPDPVPSYVATLSIVLPCANEGEFVKKTIRAVFEATPSSELKEIIVIDDASQPPVRDSVSEADLTAYRTRVIRHSTQEGLIRSKKDGGDAAKGDAVVFLDCHVKPMSGWTGPILRNLRENPRRIVVPAITSLDPDTWEEISPYGGGTKMCLTWDADFFWCNEYPGPFVPIMSGGLLAMTRFWWESIGGYDSEMRAWGGENLDQSLRTWLCGGEIRVAEGSRVAHMWRDPSNPKTMLKYRIPTDDVRRNRLRAAVAWFDGWADKVRTFPQFEDFREGGHLTIGSLENMEYYRKKLKCKGFSFYLEKFKDFYLDTGRLPDRVYNLRERSSGLCLSHVLASGKSKGFTLTACSMGSELQRFHEANLGSSKRCCSGIKAWDFDSCLTAWGAGSELTTGACDSFGRSSHQHFRLSPQGALEWQRGGGCVVPKEVKATRGPTLAARFSSTACPTHTESLGGQLLRVVFGGRCLTASGTGESLSFVTCGAGDEEKRQAWTHLQGPDAGHLRLKSAGGHCIENVGGAPALRACGAESASGQLFRANLSGALLLEAADAPLHLCAAPPPAKAVQFAECATEGQRAKLGQGYSKHDVQADGTFLLKDEALGMCLRPQAGHSSPSLDSAECLSYGAGREWYWHYDPQGGQLKSAALQLCIDANDYHSMILYPCYPPGQNIKQRYVLRSNGWVEMPRSWADNGRLRYPAMCLDSDPVSPTSLTVDDCYAARKAGVFWERASIEVPLETQLWRQAAAKGGFMNRYQ